MRRRRVFTQGRVALRDAITVSRWTVEEAAHRLEISTRALRLILGGYNRPSLPVAISIEALFGVPPRLWAQKVKGVSLPRGKA